MLVSLDQSSLISWECSSYLIAWVAESFSTEMRRLARGRRLIPQRRSYLASTSKICRSPPDYWKLSNARPSTYLTNVAFQKRKFSFRIKWIHNWNFSALLFPAVRWFTYRKMEKINLSHGGAGIHQSSEESSPIVINVKFHPILLFPRPQDGLSDLSR